MELSRERLSNFFKDFNEFWVDLETSVSRDKLASWYEHFQRDYPETFRIREAMDIDEGQTSPKKPNLAEIRERLLCKRMKKRFTNYEGVMSDPNIDMMAKIIYLQKAIDDTTRRKVYFALLQGELLQSCFDESKEAYKETLKLVKIKRPWVQFLRKLHKLVLNYNQLQYCMVSLRFIRNNFKAIEEICKSEPDNWK